MCHFQEQNTFKPLSRPNSAKAVIPALNLIGIRALKLTPCTASFYHLVTTFHTYFSGEFLNKKFANDPIATVQPVSHPLHLASNYEIPPYVVRVSNDVHNTIIYNEHWTASVKTGERVSAKLFQLLARCDATRRDAAFRTRVCTRDIKFYENIWRSTFNGTLLAG